MGAFDRDGEAEREWPWSDGIILRDDHGIRLRVGGQQVLRCGSIPAPPGPMPFTPARCPSRRAFVKPRQRWACSRWAQMRCQCGGAKKLGFVRKRTQRQDRGLQSSLLLRRSKPAAPSNSSRRDETGVLTTSNCKGPALSPRIAESCGAILISGRSPRIKATPKYRTPFTAHRNRMISTRWSVVESSVAIRPIEGGHRIRYRTSKLDNVSQA